MVCILMIPEELNFNFIRDKKKTWQATMMKKCKCSNLGVDLEKTAKCRCLRQTAVTQLSNKLTKTASSGRKRKAVLASLTKEQLVKRFLELESRVAVLEMQMEVVKRAEEEIAEVGEEDYDFFKGEFPMSRSLFLLFS